MRIRTVAFAAAACAGLLLLTSCSATGGALGAGAPSAGAGSPSGTVVVFAAASLTESFTAIGRDFEKENPGVRVTFNFGGSPALAAQIAAGAPADVYASASRATMTSVSAAGEVDGDPSVFARNSLEIAVPPGNPARITGLADFADQARKVALCAPEVPCGALAAKVFATAGIRPAPDTLEQDVKGALIKVERNEVDCALVYRTDVTAAGSAVDGIDFPESTDAVTDYLVGALRHAPNLAAARAFTSFVLSPSAQARLGSAGFVVG
jgi:molybdate transport system substrate-binding protein